MIEFECPACDAVIRVGDNAVGKKGRCPKCQTLLLVPDPDDFEDDEEYEDEQEQETPPESDSEPEPPPELEPIAPLNTSPDRADASEPEPEPLVIVTELPVDAPTESASPAVAEEAPQEPASQEPAPQEPAPPAAPPYDPDNPFAFATGSSAVTRATAGRSTRRRGRGSSRSTMPIVAVLAGVFILLVGGGLLYLMLQPDLSGELVGDRFDEVDLPAVSFAGPTNSYPAVQDVLSNEGLPLKSEYISVVIDTADGRPRVLVAPGPQAVPVRVALGKHEGIQAALASNREQIAQVKQQELTSATANMYRDYDAYLEDGTSMSKLPEYRDHVALNAAVGPVGYAIEARVSGYPFPCVYEDSEGYCYYFLPAGVQAFQLRGRQLPDGSTPLPVEIDVTLKDAASPTIASPESNKKEEKKSEPGDEPKKDKSASEEDAPPDETKKENGTNKAMEKDDSMEEKGDAED